jgi:hypothetical protein
VWKQKWLISGFDDVADRVQDPAIFIGSADRWQRCILGNLWRKCFGCKRNESCPFAPLQMPRMRWSFIRTLQDRTMNGVVKNWNNTKIVYGWHFLVGTRNQLCKWQFCLEQQICIGISIKIWYKR